MACSFCIACTVLVPMSPLTTADRLFRAGRSRVFLPYVVG